MKIIYEGDWIIIENNGEIIAEGHSFTPSEILNLLGIEYEEEYV